MYHETENKELLQNNLPSLFWRLKVFSILPVLLIILQLFDVTLSYTENPSVPEASTTVVIGKPRMVNHEIENTTH